MRRILQTFSWLSLFGMITAACLQYGDRIDMPAARHWLFALTAVWFLVTPFWMEQKAKE